MIRDNETKHIFKCRQVFNQFLVDMAAKIESERLLYIRLNQTKLRVENYVHLRDAISSEKNITDVGKSIILPSNFIGSPRHMQEYTQDAMTYVRKFGRPDLFITFTCNPSWEDIQKLLINGQSASDRHDIIARVFNMKVKKLMDFIIKHKIYGDVQCWMYCIEWQKRGLPHIHILIWLKEKIKPSNIDKIISAELPNESEDPELFNIIKRHMIHGPCGTLNSKSPCMVDGKCCKRYPRELICETQTGHDGYPMYRRRAVRDGGYKTVIKVNGVDIDIDNRWVVPYSPILSKAFKTHINVEFCNSVQSIKYICKYIYKGNDMAVFGLSDVNTNDEIKQYQLGRYISSSEAVWRILGFKIHDRYPAVMKLDVHLENGQRVYYTEKNVHQKILNPPNTTLVAFFKLCQKDEFAKRLLYYEIPAYYTWNKTKKIFVRRIKGKIINSNYEIRKSDTIGRVYTIHPNNDECYYLRMLLHQIRGPTCFNDLKTIDGCTFSTYRETCLNLGLLENDNHWNLALTEATITNSPHSIRILFAIILTMCSPSNPRGMINKFERKSILFIHNYIPNEFYIHYRLMGKSQKRNE